jgi:hypothetical protein
MENVSFLRADFVSYSEEKDGTGQHIGSPKPLYAEQSCSAEIWLGRNS